MHLGGGGWGEGERIGDGRGGIIVVLFKPDKRSITLKFILLLYYIAYNFTSYCFIMLFDIVTVDVEFAYSYKLILLTLADNEYSKSTNYFDVDTHSTIMSYLSNCKSVVSNTRTPTQGVRSVNDV